MTTQSLKKFSARKLELLEHVLQQEDLKPVDSEAILPLQERKGGVLMSYAQQRVWFMEQMEGGKGIYNLRAGVRMKGELKVEVMRRVVREVVRRHEVLRTRFGVEGGKGVQIIEGEGKVELEVGEVSGGSKEEREEELRREMKEEGERGFDVEEGPLLRVKVWKVGEGEHVLLLTMHHMVSDGWSMGVLLREVSSLYEDYEQGRESRLGELRIQYADYAGWQREWLQGERLEEQVSYWRKQLEGVGVLEMGTDHVRPGVPSYRGGKVKIEVGKELVGRVKELSKREGVTVYMVVVAAVQMLLWRYSGQEDVAVGTVIANRRRGELEGLIGFFANTLVLRTRVGGEERVKEVLRRVREVCLGAYGHQDLPFEKLVEEMNPGRDLSRNPLFQVMVTLQNVPGGEMKLGGVELERMEGEEVAARFDLDWTLEENEGGGLSGELVYARDLWEEETAERMVRHWVRGLEEMVRDEEQRVWEVEWMEEGERVRVLEEWNGTERGRGERERSVQERIEEQVRKRGGETAVECGGEEVSYEELNGRANQLANYLRGEGVGAETRVGLCMERGVEMLVGMLGIVKAGGAYVPLDPEYPEERLRYMVRDAEMGMVVSEEKLRGRWEEGGVRIVSVDGEQKERIGERGRENPEEVTSGENAAYVIYTSGSSGEPKGVVVSHGNVSNFLAAMDEVIGGSAPGAWLAVTSMCFDISVLELLWTLTHGDRIVLHHGLAAGKRLRQSCQKKRVLEFSLFFFAAEDTDSPQKKYRLLLDAARFADQHGFCAVWTPERHFHSFGGLYPNPSVTGAAVAAITEQIEIRAGSVVLPLHDPLRVAEEWSVVDNLSGGRAAISFASGWNTNDFVLSPNHFDDRKKRMLQEIESVRALWRGGTLLRRNGSNESVTVEIFPKPVQAELPVWLTAAGNIDTFRIAGEMGANLLTHLLGQDLKELAEKIACYRDAYKQAGHSGKGKVAVMLHTFVGRDQETSRSIVYAPFCRYLEQSVDLMRNFGRTLDIDLESAALSKNDLDAVVQHAFDRYYSTSGLMGDPVFCEEMLDRIANADIDEVACMIDFGIQSEQVLESLLRLTSVKDKFSKSRGDDPPLRYAPMDVQCTPTYAEGMVEEWREGGGEGEKKWKMRKMLVGGEAMGEELARELEERVEEGLYNMYGPTETTVWSCVEKVEKGKVGKVGIGKPIRNTRVYVLDERMKAAPVGVVGELYIGGAGVARGYWKRAEQTAERFVPDPYGRGRGGEGGGGGGEGGGGRLYRTGDAVRWREDGVLEYVGRMDEQVKIRGYRIEPGEIEAALRGMEEIREAVVVAREDVGVGGGKRLVGYVVGEKGKEVPGTRELRRRLQGKLPEYMIPAVVVELEELPQTPNGKLDRRGLPLPERGREEEEGGYEEPASELEEILCGIWEELLGVERVGRRDNFFELGGDSILSLQIVAKARAAGVVGLSVQQMFQYQTVGDLARQVKLEKGEQRRKERRRAEGWVELTPIQRWFFEQRLEEPWHFNQAVMLRAPAGAEVEAVEEVLGELIEHHDALRMRFEQQEDGSWEQRYGSGIEEGGRIERVDLRGESGEGNGARIEEEATRLQASLDLKAGRLVRGVWFELDGGERRLLLIIHHLVVDGVSWRILLEDLEKLWRQKREGKILDLGRRSTSYGEWSQELREQAEGEQLQGEWEYWEGMGKKTTRWLGREEGKSGERGESEPGQVQLELSEEESRILQQEVPRAYQTRIQEVLLTAVVRSLERWNGRHGVLLELEGHGREELGSEGVDISRTVGWFTTIYPMYVELEGGEAGNDLKKVKEQMRGVPSRGLGYGVLRYLQPDGEQRVGRMPRAEVLFNYLGQFDAGVGEQDWWPGEEPVGRTRSARNKPVYGLEINAYIREKRLHLHWDYSGTTFDCERTQRLAHDCMAELRQLMEHCRRAPRSFTPSDFPLARLSQNELDLILASGDIENIYPPSPMQQGMLYHTLQAPAIGLYVNQLCLELEGNLDQAAFRNAWDQVTQRHPALRTSFIWKRLAQPIEIVNRRVRLDFAQDNLGGANREEQRRSLDDYLRTDRAFEFDLERAPLMRIRLLRANDQLSYLLWTYHNLLLDGWSVPLVLKEVLHFYQASLENKEARLPSPTPYSEYVRWIQKQDRSRAHEFWHELLSGFDSPIRLGIDERQRNISAGAGLDKQVLRLSRHETQQLERFAQSHSLTLNTVVQGAWSVLLANYSGQSDVVFGTATAGRPADIPGVSDMVGLFINTLPVRVQLHRDTTPLGCLRLLQTQQSEARRFEYSPLVDIQSWSDLPRGTSLFECLFVFENYPVDGTLQFQPNGLNIRNSSAQEATNYPLNAVVTPGHSMALQIAYDPQRFPGRTVGRMLEYWQQVLREIVKHPTRPMNRLQMLCPQERKQLLSVWNGTTEDCSSPRCVHEMFEAQVDRNPTAVAAVFKDQTLRYGELNERSNQLARHLQALGVTAEVRVGILLNRGFDLLIAIFAVLKAGGAYVPLNPEYPKDRLKYIVQDAAGLLVLSKSDCCANFPETSARLVLLDRESEQITTHASTNLRTMVLPQNLAYVIYTSGSTGEPKGVLIAHRSVSNLADAQIRAFEVSSDTTLLQFVASSFDAAVSDWSSALLAGGKLVLVEDGIIGGEGLHNLLRETKVNIASVPPGVLALTSPDGLPDLETVITGGEQIPIELATKWAPGRRMINAYGPTECTVTSTLAQIEPRQRPAIGRPIRNLQVYVLNQELDMVPVGVAGELHIAGVGLARGYLNQPALTAERFVANPFSTEPGARMYRTGDLGRWTFDGTLEYLGRIDDQIKTRGYRIEPGDIETALRQSAGVSDAAVVPHVDQNGNQRLIAHVVMNRDLPDGFGQLRDELSKKLPMYMVPSVFHRLEELPRTATGKLDRKALRIVDLSAVSDECPYVAPRTEVEKMLCEIWAQVLGKKQVGTQETFWDAGGHSLLAAQMLEQVRRVCGIELEVRHLFERPTVRALAEIIEGVCAEGMSASGTLLDEIESLPEHEVTSLLAKLQRS